MFKSMMRPDLVIFSKLNIDRDLRLPSTVEPLGIQDFSSQRSVGSFVVSVLPRAPGADLHRLDPAFSVNPGDEQQ